MSGLKYQRKTHKLDIEKEALPVIKYLFRISICTASLFSLLLLTFPPAHAADVIGPEVRLQDREIFVSAGLSLDENHLEELRNGVTKEFRFYIDLFRVWKMWPDEFILSRSFTRTLMSDPVKMEYTATSGDGNVVAKKRFKSFDSMLQWSLSVSNLKLADVRDLEPGVYFVRVTIESRIRKLPPVIGYFMIFLPENEFKVRKDSRFITIGPAK